MKDVFVRFATLVEHDRTDQQCSARDPAHDPTSNGRRGCPAAAAA
jgi:hypothetical protein